MALTGNEVLHVQGLDGASHPAATTQQITVKNIADYTAGTANESPTFVNATLTGLLYESSTTGTAGISALSTSQVSAITNSLVAKELNLVATTTTNGGIALPASAPGLTIIVENATTSPITVWGSGTDTINGVATATGVQQMAGSVVLYTCYYTGAWFANGLGTGYSGSLETVSNGSYVAAGTSASTATTISTMQAIITGGTQAVSLPTASPGTMITVVNNSGASVNVYAPVGGSMNGVSVTNTVGYSALTNNTIGLFVTASGGTSAYWNK